MKGFAGATLRPSASLQVAARVGQRSSARSAGTGQRYVTEYGTAVRSDVRAVA
jgi:hypothetical protein